MLKDKKDSLAFYSVVGTLCVSILALLPASVLGYVESKGFITILAILISVIIWSVLILRGQKVTVPKSYLFIFLALFLLSGLISSLFSTDISSSLMGFGFESRTLTAVFALTALSFIVYNTFQTTDRFFVFYSTIAMLWLIAGAVFLVSLVLSLATDVEPLSVLGSYNNLALFAGFISIVSLIHTQLISLKKRLRWLYSATLYSSVLVLILINFILSWYILLFVSILAFGYIFAFGSNESINPLSKKKKRFPVMSLLVVVVSLLGILGHSLLAGVLTERIGLYAGEVRPSWEATAIVSVASLKEDPLFGMGLNRFEHAWQLYKPREVNDTFAWNVNFMSGFGYIPSYAVSAGGVGMLLWTLFLSLFLLRGAQLVITSRSQLGKVGQLFSVTSYLGGLFLWITLVVYVPSISLVALAFILTGVFVASLSRVGIVKSISGSIGDNPRWAFNLVVVSSLAIILVVVMMYGILVRMFAQVTFANAIDQYSQNASGAAAYATLNKALDLHESDAYHRFASQLLIERIQLSIRDGSIQNMTEDEVGAVAANAVQHTLDATALDDTHAANWLSRANAYALLTLMGLPDAEGHAVEAYEKVAELSPVNPVPYFLRGQLSLSLSKIDQARSELGTAMQLKPDYTEALYLLAQIEINSGDIQAALELAQQGVQITPNNFVAYFQLGLLQYESKLYSEAVISLSRAVELNPFYANAMYFLGLSQFELGNMAEAKSFFERILELNPGNAQVTQILENLERGRSPLDGVNTEGVGQAPLSQ